VSGNLNIPDTDETSHSKHVKKHHERIYRNPGLDDPWSAGRAWLDNQGWGSSSSQPSKTCFRAFEFTKVAAAIR
jgi:hypothetical protein